MSARKSAPKKSSRRRQAVMPDAERKRQLHEDSKVEQELAERNLNKHRRCSEKEYNRTVEKMRVTKGRGSDVTRTVSASAQTTQSDLVLPHLKRDDTRRRRADKENDATKARYRSLTLFLAEYMKRQFDRDSVAKGEATAMARKIRSRLRRDIAVAMVERGDKMHVDACRSAMSPDELRELINAVATVPGSSNLSGIAYLQNALKSRQPEPSTANTSEENDQPNDVGETTSQSVARAMNYVEKYPHDEIFKLLAMLVYRESTLARKLPRTK